MSNQEREAFEQLVRETCSTDEYTFKRDGGAYFRMTCAKTYDGLPAREMASVQTLWNFYQAGAAYQRAQPSGIEITKLLSCVRYLTGIAERGLKRQIREDESVESFVLGYVQSLERLQVDGWKLVPVEPTPGMAKVSTWDMNSFYPASKVWADMLAAAPSAPAAQGDE